MKSTLLLTMLVGAALSASMAVNAASGTPPKPKLSVKQAEAAALKKFPGRATSAKYEFEDGHWQYAVIVNTKKHGMYEVEVNPTTGAILDTEKTTAAAEAQETAADAKAAAGKKSSSSASAPAAEPDNAAPAAK